MAAPESCKAMCTDGGDSEQCLWHQLASGTAKVEEGEVCHRCNQRCPAPAVKVLDGR